MGTNRPANMNAGQPNQEEAEDFYANGILADTGRPLSVPTAVVARAAKYGPDDTTEENLASARIEDEQVSYGVIGEVDSQKLAEAGWGIIFPAQAPQEIKDALLPLLEHRRQEAGDRFHIFENYDGYAPGESCTHWLARHGVSMHPVDPVLGVPFYLLLVGSPEQIPFEFQYQLDIYWAVGRLHFDNQANYRSYAESVVAYEKAEKLPNARSIAIFSTNHAFDRATQMFTSDVALPLARGDDLHSPLGRTQKFQLESFIGESATKEALGHLLRGTSVGGPPALLLTGSHGMAFRADDPRQAAAQGALVCQDWEGYGEIGAEDYFAASDLSADAHVHGLVHFCFACYGAGWPQFDNFPEDIDAQPKQISPKPSMARLPQKLLTHPNGGALAVLGHIDRAWHHSFRSAKAGAQVQGFRDVMGRLLRGDRIGQATDQFDVRRAALSFDLADMRRAANFGARVSDKKLASLWIARNDARDYIVLGDPAVRLRVDQLVDRRK